MKRPLAIIAILAMSLLAGIIRVKLPGIEWEEIYNRMPNLPDRVVSLAFLLAWYFGLRGNRRYF